MKLKPTCVSCVLIIKSIVSILRWFEKPVSWPVETKRARISAVLGIRIFVESGLELEERLIVKTTVRLLDSDVLLYEQWEHIRHISS